MRAIRWLRLAAVTIPLLVVFFLLAAVQESAAWILGIRRARGDAERGTPTTRVRDTAAGSVVFVPAEVWARADVAVRQDDEAAVNGR